MRKDRKSTAVIHGEPSVRIGKNGLYDGLIKEIERKLKEEKVIKVRVLRSYLSSTGKDTRSIAEEVARLVAADLVTVRGHIFVLRKRRKPWGGGRST